MSRSLATTVTRSAPSRSALTPSQRLLSGLTMLLLATLLLTTPAMAADWYASPTGAGNQDCMSPANACEGIQAAIDKAAAYDTVHVGAGNYAFISNRIRIEKEGLRLIGEHSPFAVDPATQPGTPENKAINAIVLKAATAGVAGTNASGMIWVRNVKNVHIENLYIEVNAATVSCGWFCSRQIAKEAVVASGEINGLELINNYIKITGGTGAIAIGVNVAGTSDSSVPEGELRGSGNFVSIIGNVIEPTASPAALPKRAIALENTVGLIKGNQIAATTQDMWIQSPTASTSNPVDQRTLKFEDNWYFGRLQLYLAAAYNLSSDVVIRDNHFIKPASSFSPPGMPSGIGSALGNGSEAHSLRMMTPQDVGTVIEGNEFKGFSTFYRALWVQNRNRVTIQDNVFTPDTNQSDYTAAVVANREVWNGTPDPGAFDVTFLRNTFNASSGGAPINKGKAILFVNDNDPTGVAPGGSLQIGDGTAANANLFDANIGWYVALDDRTCIDQQNHTGSGCNGTSTYAIGEGIAYSSGSNKKSTKRPFEWDVTAPGNTFGDVFMDDMDQTQYDAVWAKTFDNHNKVQSTATVGNVIYGWMPPADISLTVTAAGSNTNRTGAFQVLDGVTSNAGRPADENVKMSLTIARVDGAPIVMDGNPLADSAGDSMLMEFEDADCKVASGNLHDGWCLYRLTPAGGGTTLSATFPQISPGFPASTGDFHVYRQRANFRVPGAYKITQTVFGETTNTEFARTESILTVKQALAVSFIGNNPTEYNGGAQPLGFTVSPASNLADSDLAAKVSLTYAGSTDAPVNAGDYEVIAISNDGNYVIEPAATANYVINKIAGTLEWGTLNFPYDKTIQAVAARVVESGTLCSVTPGNVGPAIGNYPVSATCNDNNYAVAGASATASIGGGNHVHVLEADRYYTSVAEALADASTEPGMTVEVAPGVSTTPIVLTKSVNLIGGRDFTPPARPGANPVGPTAIPLSILDGGNMAANGITIAPGVIDATISGFEVRNFTNNCVYASGANHGSLISDNVVHGCGVHGIAIAGGGGIDDVTISNNEVYATGLLAGNGRGIVVWDGVKRDITITNNIVRDLSGCCGIELQDGTATGVTVTDNTVSNTGDSGMSFIQLTSGSPTGTPNTIAGNTIQNTGRFGIEIKIPNGSGGASGDGAIIVEHNIVTAGASASNPRDRAGIAVIRRSLSADYDFEVDATSGVIVRENTVSGFKNANAGYEGYGIVVEGLNSSVSANTLLNNDIGLQIQQGNPAGTPPGDANQDAINDWFGRGNAPNTCVSVGEGVDANDISGSTLVDQRQVPAGVQMIGQGVTNETTSARYCSINAAIAAATAGDVIKVAAGIYVEDVLIDKAITLLGAQAGTPAGPSRSSDPGVASIIIPPTAAPGMAYTMNASLSVMSIFAIDVVVDGFVLDGDNPDIHSGLAMGSADPDVDTGVFASGSNIHFINNEVRNLVYAGYYGYNGSTATQARENNVIAHNWIHNLDAPSAWGIGIGVLWNYYANIHDNLVSDARIGIQTNYDTRPVADPASNAVIRNNTLHASATGIYHNYRTSESGLGASSSYTIDGNQVFALNNAAASGVWSGLTIQAFYAGNAIITNNAVDGSALAGSGRLRLGYTGSNLISGPIVLTGGSVTGVDYGVLATDGAGYPGAVQNLVVRGMAFTDVSLAALYVEDTAPAGTETIDNSARITVGAGNTFSADIPHNAALSGPKASIEFESGVALLDRTLVRGEGQSHRGASADSNGNVRLVMPGIVNDAIADTAAGGTVTVAAGTFAQAVVVNKSVTLRGPKAGIAGHDSSRDGSGEAILAPVTGRAIVITASGVVVDGLQFGPITADRVVSIENTAGLTGIRLANNRIMNFTSNSGGGAAIFVSSNTGPATVGMQISRNLFQELLNGSSTKYAMGVKVTRAQDLLIEDNKFLRVQSNAVQLSWVTGAEMRANRIDGVVSGFTNVGVQVTYGSGIHIYDNIFGGTLQAFLFNRDSGNDVSFTCNRVHNSNFGVRGEDYGTSGAAVAPRVFHNSIQAGSRALANGLETLSFGSNWYGGGPAVISTKINLADPLLADPTDAGNFGVVGCGNNTATEIVTYAGTGNQSVAVGTAFNSLRARVQDVLGGAVVGQPIVLTAPATGASAVLGTTSGTSNYNGELSSTATANSTVGSYTVDAESGGFTTAFDLRNTIGAATITLDVGTLSASYSGSAHAVTATTNPENLSYSVTYNGGATAPTNAGTYTVVATVTDPNYTPGSITGTLTIAKASGSVSFDNLALTYSNAAQAVTAHITEEPTTVCTVSPAAVGPNVGSYPVSATCVGSNHDASGTATAVIGQANATVTLSHLIQQYDGSPKSVVATTSPAGLPVTVTYGGSATAPSAEGSYPVVATVTDGNYSGSATGTLNIVAGMSDIALVLNGPVDPVRVGDKAQYAATMLANPLLHSGETFGYKIVLSKSNSPNPLALSDLASMEVFFGTEWVDATQYFGSIPFQLVGGELVYIFPQGLPNLDDGFPIDEASWTWNFRFSFADTATYTTTAELVDGISHDPITPAVSATIATVVEAALPPTDMHLILGGPAGDVTLGSFAEYNGTLLADPTLHVGEEFFVKVTVAKNGGTMTAADFTAMQIFLGGDWVDGSDLGVVFSDDGNGNLVYLFPESQMPGGFPIEDAQWSWNFRFAYANTGVYTATAQVIPAYQGMWANPDVLASAAIATKVVAAPAVTPDMKLLLLGPVEDVQVGAPAAYAGTLLANPDDFSGRAFFVRVRLSKNGGADAMTVADLAKMELYNGGWQDATLALQDEFQTVGNDLVYLFPRPQSAFEITSPLWSWNFRFTYGSEGLYSAVADVIDAADANPVTAMSLANGSVQTHVVPQTANIALSLQGPVVGTVGEALRYTGSLTADPLPEISERFFVHVKLSKNGGSSQMTAADLAKMEISLDGGATWLERNDLPLVQNGNFLEYDFPQPDMNAGFPITGSWGWDFRFTYADAATYRAEATVVTADAAHVAVSNTATVATAVAARTPEIALQLQGPVAGVVVGQPAQYVGTLRADPLPAASERFFVKVRLHKSTGPMVAADLQKMEILQGSNWIDGADYGITFADDAGDLVYLFPKPLLDDGFPIDEAEWSWQFRFTYGDAAVYTATAQVIHAGDSSPVSAPVSIHTEVVAPSPNVSLQLNGPVADVQVDVPAAYIGTLTNHGPALTENAVVKVRVALANEVLAAADLTVEVSDGSGGWIGGSMNEVDDGLEVDFPDSNGFPIDANFGFTHAFRITYHRTGVFSATASVVGVDTTAVYATAGMYTDVVPRSDVVAGIEIDPASLYAVYNGAPHAAAAATTPVGLPVSFSYNGMAAAPVDAGHYVVVASVNSAPYVGSASAILVIDKAPSTVTIDAADLHQSATATYPVGASANPMTAGASIAVTYNGSATVPTAVGSYTVVATLVDPNFSGSASAILVVGEGAQVSISIDSAPAMALIDGNAPYTDLLEYTGSIGNTGAQTSQAVHFELEVVRIDDGNGSGGQPMAIDIDDVLACVYDPSGWSAQDPDHHYGCPQDYNSLFLSQSVGSLNGRPSTTFRYPNLAQNDLPLPTMDPAMPMPPVLFAFKHGQYQVHARVVGTDGTVYATAMAGSTVPDVAIGYNGPTSGQVEDALLSQSTLTNVGGRVDGNVIVRVTLSDAANAALSGADATMYYQYGSNFIALPWTQVGNDLVTYYGPGIGFPLEDGHNATTSAQGIFHREGSYTVLYEVVDIDTQAVVYARSEQAVEIGANLINFSVAGLNPVYTGSPLPVTVAPASVPHTVIYEPMVGASCPSTPTGNDSTAPTDAGSYCVYVAATAPYSGSWSGTLVIAKATATITLDGAVGNEVDRGFDGSVQVVTATTDPSGLTYRMSYNGDSAAPSAAGSYALLASIDDPNYSGIVTGTLIIAAQGGASIVLDDVDLVDNKIHRSYSGNAVAAITATTTPANVSYTVSYIGDGGTVYPLTATPPTNVGQYHVVATTIDANYAQVSAAGTLVIEPQAASIELDAAGLTAVYNGSAHVVTATTNPAGIAYRVTYNGLLDAPVAAGSYVVVASIADANYAAASVTDTLVISARAASIDLDAGTLAAVYDGNAHAVTATTTPAGLAYTVTYDGLLDAPVAAGSYAVVATINDPNHSGATVSGTLVISAVNASIVLDAATLSAMYDGNAHAVTATTTPAGLAYTVTYAGGSTPINAGSYAVQATITAPGHTGSASGTLVIEKAAGEVLFGQTSFQFDGASHGSSARIAQEPANVGACTLLYAPAMPIAVSDSSTVTANCEGVNYIASATAPLQITAKPVNLALAGTGSFPYTGSAYAATASVTGEVAGFAANVAIDYNPGGGNAPVAVGSYGVTASVLAGGNYSATPATGVISIGAANATVQLADLSHVWDGSNKSATVTTTPAGLAVTISYNGSATLPNAAGSYSVVATISEAGYNGFASGTLVIAKAQATVTLSDLQHAHDGSPKGATVITSPAGLDVDVRYDGSATLPSAVGSYTVHVTVTDANHSGSASDTLHITAGSAEQLAVNGAASFSGIAGQPLAGALPSVKVTDVGGNPVAGVVVTFVAGANSGLLSGAVQTTNGNGIATLGGWILDATPGLNTLSATAAGVADAVAFTAEGGAGSGALSVTITDGRTFAKFGQALTYTMTVGNAGSANLSGIEVSNVLPAELDSAGASWQCIAINGASCVNGTGDLVDTINLPAGSSVVYLLNTTAVRGPSDRISNTITVTSAAGVISATDITDVVLFRNGFELGGDGSQSVGAEVDGLGDLDGLTSIGVRIDMADLGSLNVVSVANAADGSFRVEAIVIDAKVWLRLVARTAEGEQATAWAPLAGDYAMLALEGSSLLLAGTDADLSIALERSGAFSLQQPLH